MFVSDSETALPHTPAAGHRRRAGSGETVIISRKEQDTYLSRSGHGNRTETSQDTVRELDPELEQLLLAL